MMHVHTCDRKIIYGYRRGQVYAVFGCMHDVYMLHGIEVTVRVHFTRLLRTHFNSIDPGSGGSTYRVFRLLFIFLSIIRWRSQIWSRSRTQMKSVNNYRKRNTLQHVVGVQLLLLTRKRCRETSLVRFNLIKSSI